MNVLAEMTQLAVARPAVDAPVKDVAAWFEAKSRLHAHLAELGGPDCELEKKLAKRAHERAEKLLARTR